MPLNEYYKYYLTLHQNSTCRLLHFVDQCVTLLYTGFVIYNSLRNIK